jgi:hypothetical protein
LNDVVEKGPPCFPEAVMSVVGVTSSACGLTVSVAVRVWVVMDENKNPVPGERGTLGYLEWAALYQPKTFLALLARVIPYHIIETLPENRILTREQAIEEIKERGLPPALMAMLLQAAPPPKLDPDEDPNPYGVTDTADDTGGTRG